MKTILLALILLPQLLLSQVMYSWTSGVNPGWVSSNPSNYTLGWQDFLGAVSTSDTYGGGTYFYNNSQNTTYTSSVMNTTCPSASQIHVTFQMAINLENGWDFLYFEYSTNGGATWANYGSWTGNLGLVNVVLDLPSSPTARFRFRFVSDATVNSYGSWWTTYAYYADILEFSTECITYLPIELANFTGVVGNELLWETFSEYNNDYFTIEHSTDGENWRDLVYVSGIGTSTVGKKYSVNHNSFALVVNYYRLSQTDFDGTETTHGIVAIDNSKDKTVLKVTNLLGQDIDEHEKGLILVHYSDGTFVKMYR